MTKSSRSVLALVLAALVGSMALAADQAPAVGSEKAPVAVPQLAEKLTVNGDAAKWDKIKALPAPFAKKDAGSVKLGWTEDGLYGIAQVKKAGKIVIDDTTPWSADCIELFLETDAARAAELGSNGMQLVLAPEPKNNTGKCIIVIAQGSIDASAITASWKAAEGGYNIEFLIPAKALKPAKMAADTKMSFNYSIDIDGKATEQFFSDKDTDDGYKTPKNWGMIQLAK
jgi:hypothetical protein